MPDAEKYRVLWIPLVLGTLTELSKYRGTGTGTFGGPLVLLPVGTFTDGSHALLLSTRFSGL